LVLDGTADRSFGATDPWLADGRLGAPGSRILRQCLASVRGKVGDVVEEQQIVREIRAREIYPLIKDDIGDIELVQEIVSAGLRARQRTSVQVISGPGTIPVPDSNALRSCCVRDLCGTKHRCMKHVIFKLN
jgi:hypothetical protein